MVFIDKVCEIKLQNNVLVIDLYENWDMDGK